MRKKTLDENEIIAAAKQLGIKLTNAELGSELCEAWADRVRWAKVCFDKSRTEDCQRAIEDANAYRLEDRHEVCVRFARGAPAGGAEALRAGRSFQPPAGRAWRYTQAHLRGRPPSFPLFRDAACFFGVETFRSHRVEVPWRLSSSIARGPSCFRATSLRLPRYESSKEEHEEDPYCRESLVQTYRLWPLVDKVQPTYKFTPESGRF